MCPRCASAANPADAYCAVCGRPLTRIRWRAATTDAAGHTRVSGWQEASGRVAVQRSARHVQVQLLNEGVTTAALVLTDDTIRALPSWLRAGELSEQVLQLPPDETRQLDIPIDSEQLQQSYDHDADAAESLGATLCLHSSLHQDLDLDFLLVRQPRLLPGGSLYRYLPVELLRGAGTRQTLVLHNESAEALELVAVRVREGDEETPAGHRRLPAASLLRPQLPDPSPDLPRPVEAGKSLTLEVELRLDPTAAIMETEPGWFDGHIEVHCKHQQDELRLDCRLRGSVVRAPRLEADSSELTIPFSRLRETHRVSVRNRGHLPLRLGDIQLLHRHENGWQAAPRPDWLSVRGTELGQLLEPGADCTLELRVDPEVRPRHVAHEEWGQRRLVLEHDGWIADRRDTGWTLDVNVEFGRVADRFAAGIDFGTSSSVVCILGDERAYPLLLELGQPRPSLASLMYFRSDQPARDTSAVPEDAFLFGQQAHHSAGIDPANLVRSIKTVIARDPETAYNFLYRRGDGFQRAPYSAQQLLDIFIAELLGRAERGVTLLGPDAQRDLRLQGERVVFQKAVFSHPVEVTEPMRGALMDAAHRAGVNLDQQEVDAFFEERCVDEASAAVLAYVDARERGRVAAGEPFLPIERVLCFDMGGGTTDLAAVEVHDLDRYAGTDPNAVTDDIQVTVALESNAGRRLGGDDLDVLLAEWLLTQVRKGQVREGQVREGPVREGQVRGTGATDDPLSRLLDEILHALHARLFSEYQSLFRQRARHRQRWTDWAPQQLEDLAIDLYSSASGLLRAAETAKKELSRAQQAELSLDLAPSVWSAYQPSDDDVPAEPSFSATIDRATFEALVRERLDPVLPLLDRVVERAGWQWPEVTTLLFTGQGVRVPVIRQRIKEVVAERRNSDTPLILVEPDGPRETDDAPFDPKHCVAIGAALWQLSREEGRWLRLRTTLHERLNFDLQRKAGRRRFRTVPGLERNTELPAEVQLREPANIDRLELYRDQEPYVRFQFEPASELVLQVRGPADLWIVANGKETKGVQLQ